MPRPQRTVPWLEKRGDVWYANWYDTTARRNARESLRTRDDVEAKIRFAEFLIGGPRSAGRSGGLTAGDILDAYDKEHVQVSVAAPRRQQFAIRNLKAFFANIPIGEINIPKARAYTAARRAGEIGGGKRRTDPRGQDSTIRRELGVLIAAANHARRWRRITADQMPQLERPPEPQAALPKWFTKKQLRALFDAADGPLRDFCYLAYYTGSRRDAIERLQVSQVDLPNGRITLSLPGERATKKRRPVVPIYPEIREVVEKLLETTETAWLFGRPHSFYKPFKALCADLGLEAHPHMLRHSRATHMLMDGESIYKVARLLGDTVATVEKVYGHSSIDYLQTKSAVD